MTGHHRTNDYLRQSRHDRLLRELEHDPYHSKRKIAGPATCGGCGASYADGRWSWRPPAQDAVIHTCPACQRIADGVPAAFLTVSGDFARCHRDEITHLIRNHEEHERAEHPLARIMDQQIGEDDSLEYTFTDPHLARGIGEALHHAYQGELDYHHDKGEVLLRVHWRRD